MTTIDADVVILGSGFGGSITALVLERIGLRPVLIDRQTHPRFAIGESSTPVADFVLRALARRYDLPRLEPLAKYGTWQATYPQVICGPKRGFSYFHHPREACFIPRADHANELLVAASSHDDTADTHWLRASVDTFLVEEVRSTGIPFFDQTEISLTETASGWELAGHRLGEPLRILGSFVIDATGEAGVVLRTLGIGSDVARLATHSRTVFAHFAELGRWREWLTEAGAHVDDHPFDCDHAALHHIIEEGWMWQLRFNNGVTSAGFVLDSHAHPLDAAPPAEEEWGELLKRHPSIAEQFMGARIIAPPGKLLRTGGMQRLAARSAGANWALLPGAAGFIDPLHSTGIAQTLCGIERLARILAEHWHKPSLEAELQGYDATLRQEFLLIDKLVSGCYRARHFPRLFDAFAMLYFAAATTYERRRHSGALRDGAAFLCADDLELGRIVNALWHSLHSLTDSRNLSEPQMTAFETDVADSIRPYNHAGLCDPHARNMYRFTAAPV